MIRPSDSSPCGGGVKAQEAAFAVAEEKAGQVSAMKSDEPSSLPYATARILQRARPSGPFLLRIEGTSMLPLIPPGAAVKVEPSSATPHLGDVVLRIGSSGPIVHRVVWRHRLRGAGGRVALTKGDNALRLDSPCDGRDIVGVVRRVHGRSKDGRLCIKTLPHLCGVWIALLSLLPGLLSRILARDMPNGQRGKPRRTIAWLILWLFRRIVRKAIYFAASDFSRGLTACAGIAIPVTNVSAGGSSCHGKTTSR